MHRKILFLLLLMMSVCTQVRAQEDSLISGVGLHMNSPYQDPRFSIEIYGNASYHFLHSPDWIYEDRIRYAVPWGGGVGILISKHIQDFRFGIGCAYYKLRYRHRFGATESYVYDIIESISIPVQFTYTKGWVNPLIICVVSKPIYFNNAENQDLRDEINKMTWFPSQGNTTPPNFPIQSKLNWNASLIVGCDFRIPAGYLLNIHTSVYYAYQTNIGVLLSNDEPTPENTLYDGKSSIGMRMGLEFMFNARKKSRY